MNLSDLTVVVTSIFHTDGFLTHSLLAIFDVFLQVFWTT